MKKFLNYFLILTLVPVLVLSSCKKTDDTEDPVDPKGTFADLKDYMVVNNLDLPALLDGWVIAPTLVSAGGIVEDADYTIPGYHVFDIRGADDFNAGHIKGAINVVLADVVTTAANYADKPILVVCYTGQTAGRAAMALRLSGYSAKVMKFGFSYWSSDTYTVGSETRSFDKWTGNIGDPAVGHQNWVTDASDELPTNDYPGWESDNTEGAAILAEKVTEMLARSDWKTVSADVLADAGSFNIYNFWTNDDYLAFGHFDGAYQIKPISIDGDIIKAFPTSDDFQVYCYTGQTSSFTCAWLQVLGYNAKSILFGVNSMSHTALDDAGKPSWHHSLEYEYETTK